MQTMTFQLFDRCGAGEEIDLFWNDRSKRRLIVLEVAADGPFPVDGRRVRHGRVSFAIERAHDGLADFCSSMRLIFSTTARTTMRAVSLVRSGMRPSAT